VCPVPLPAFSLILEKGLIGLLDFIDLEGFVKSPLGPLPWNQDPSPPQQTGPVEDLMVSRMAIAAFTGC